ncbi:MAG: hypothetical protein LBF97_04225 [Elusimicrobiota bacterium]|jgi:hypothetical protein|nr:hypothetical protein [Elusimicrobiota bacterium]
MSTIIGNIFIPILVAFIYFIMSFYIKKIQPLRVLIIGEKTYSYAFWIFFSFGLFLIGRPIQILCGNHPAPLIISNIREFIMIAFLAPCVLLTILNQFFFDQEHHFTNSKRFIFSIFAFCILLGIFFIYVNITSIAGSREVFKYNILNLEIIGFDGNWFFGGHKNFKYLFIIRLISPIFIMLISGILIFYKAFTYPANSIYQNLPKKFFLLGFSILIFIIFLLATGLLAYFNKSQTQWYYLGGLLSGILGFISVYIPPKNFVIKNDVKNNI